MRPDWKTLDIETKSAMLRKFINKGMSSGKITMQFANASRSAIVGHARRYGITLANSKNNNNHHIQIKSKMEYRRSRSSVKSSNNKNRTTIPNITNGSNGSGVPFIAAATDGLCKWPLWDEFEGPEVSKCCGSPRHGDGPYCEQHAARSVGRGTESERTAHKVLERYT